mmetsp:Transcript_6541/g.13701  ORF Transcript_6541/g.13701 Transcript_6541/m.13701 type:complete len:281 (+) Transcript_6541:1817-2659(+)
MHRIPVVVSVRLPRADLFPLRPPSLFPQEPPSRNETEPWAPQQRPAFLRELLREPFRADPPHVVHLVRVGLHGQAAPVLRSFHAYEQYVVDLVFAPRGVVAVGDGVRRPVVHARQKPEIRVGHLLTGDAELVFKLADGGVFRARDGSVRDRRRAVVFGGSHSVEGVRTARVRPDVGKSNLAGGTLLQQHLPGLFVEQKYGEGAVQNAPRLLRGEDVRLLLALRTCHVVVAVQDQHGVAQHELLLGHGVAIPDGRCGGVASRGGRSIGHSFILLGENKMMN